jgi:hypothetical protein
MRNTVVYSTRTGNPNHAAMVAVIHAAPIRPARTITVCSSTHVEVHELGEFPLTCAPCHRVWAEEEPLPVEKPTRQRLDRLNALVDADPMWRRS